MTTDYFEISSSKNPRFLAACRLRKSRERKKQNRIIIDGFREIEKATRAGVELIEIYVSSSTMSAENLQQANEISNSSKCSLLNLPKQLFEKVIFGERANEPVAVAKTPTNNFDFLKKENGNLLVVLEGIEKPGNVGAVFRTASAANVDGIIVANSATDLYNPNTIRASLGTLFSLPSLELSTLNAIEWLRENSFQTFATRVDGAKSYLDVDFTNNCAIVLGSESNGLSDLWQGDDVQSVIVPMSNVVDSLNISATAAILIYEAYRQSKIK